MLKIPREKLFIVGWDDRFPTQVGPFPLAYYIGDTEDHLIFPDKDCIRVDGDNVLVSRWDSYRNSKVCRGCYGTWVDVEKISVEFIPGGCLILLPKIDQLSPEILEILEIPCLEIPCINIDGNYPVERYRITYATKEAGDLIMRRLVAYFYFLGCKQLSHGQTLGADNVARSICAGPRIPHPYLLIAGWSRNQGKENTAQEMTQFADAIKAGGISTEDLDQMSLVAGELFKVVWEGHEASLAHCVGKCIK